MPVELQSCNGCSSLEGFGLLVFGIWGVYSSNVWGLRNAYLDDFIVNYNGERRIGTVVYSDKVDRRGYVKARVWHDADQDGVRDKGEKFIAKYKADS